MRRSVFSIGVLTVSLLAAAVCFAPASAGAYSIDPTDCSYCHGSGTPTAPKTWVAGVHGGCTSITDDCKACHFVHSSPGSKKLLFDDTVAATCQTCHDATGAGGVYGNLTARGVSVAASHSFDAADVVPGGDGATGGDRTQTFTGEGGMLSCDDCHSPHDARTVAPFLGDRKRGMDAGGPPSSKLLKTRPTSSLTTVTVYGSDWCASCHRGRHSGGAVINHPVDSLVITTTPFVYERVAKVTAAGSLTTTLGTMGWSNFGYVMPSPRTTEQSGHAPICQQCHEDARNVGEPGAAVPYSVTSAYGQNPANNPRFQDFPHETANRALLIELEDDLCLNCHPVASLP